MRPGESSLRLGVWPEFPPSPRRTPLGLECAVDKRRCDLSAVARGCPRPPRAGVSELHRESTDLDRDVSSLPWSQSPGRADKETTLRQSVAHSCWDRKNPPCR